VRTLGEEILHLRIKAGLSQGGMAAAMGVTQPFISHVESGLRGIPAKRMYAFATALNVSVDHFRPFVEGFTSTRKPVLKGKKTPAKRRAKA
jgi:transcriptional regulator with XRE-family HTH domain